MVARLISVLAATSLLYGGTVAATKSSKVKTGSFVGKQSSTGTSAIGTAVVETADHLHVRIRPDRQRVYISLRSADGTGTLWKQSFVMRTDETSGGVRRISYGRPTDGSRSGRYNVAKLKDYFKGETGKPATLDQLTGEGSIEIRGNQLSWRNAGQGMLTVPGRAPFRLSYDETFKGVRAGKKAKSPAGKSALDIMQGIADQAIAEFRSAGGILIPKPATGRMTGVNPNTGAQLEVSGNGQEGLRVRVTQGGQVAETLVAPNGKITRLTMPLPAGEPRTAVIVLQ